MKLILLTQTVSPGQPGRKANYAYHTLDTQPYTNVFDQVMSTVRLLIATRDIHAGEELLGSYSVMNPDEDPLKIKDVSAFSSGLYLYFGIPRMF